jgi:hypothetical protein
MNPNKRYCILKRHLDAETRCLEARVTEVDSNHGKGYTFDEVCELLAKRVDLAMSALRLCHDEDKVVYQQGDRTAKVYDDELAIEEYLAVPGMEKTMDKVMRLISWAMRDATKGDSKHTPMDCKNYDMPYFFGLVKPYIELRYPRQLKDAVMRGLLNDRCTIEELEALRLLGEMRDERLYVLVKDFYRQ